MSGRKIQIAFQKLRLAGRDRLMHGGEKAVGQRRRKNFVKALAFEFIRGEKKFL